MFTEAYWRDEIRIFEEAWEDPDLTAKKAGWMIRGLCTLTHCMGKHIQGETPFTDEVNNYLRDALFKSRSRFGGAWFAAHIRVFNNHLLPCGQGLCPCFEYITDTPPE